MRSFFFRPVSFNGSSTFSMRRQHRDEIERLEDEPDVRVAPARDLPVAELPQIFAQHPDLAAGGLVHGGDQVQQRGLARTGGPHQRHEIAAADIEIDVVSATT